MNYIKGLSISLLILISLTDLLCLQAGEFETLAETEEVPEAYVPRAVIKLRTGDRIVGELKPEEIRFQSNRFGIVNIKVNNMFSFAEDKLSLKDGNVISGKFIDNLIVTTESGNTFSGIKWIDIEELSMKSPEEGVDGKEALLETAENKPPPYTPPNYTKIFKDQYKDRGSSYYGPTMNYGPQGLSNMIDSKVPILKPGEFEKEYMKDVMPPLSKDMMKPLSPKEEDRKTPFVYDV